MPKIKVGGAPNRPPSTGGNKMKTIVFLNQKGGIGKTTLSTHLAWFLAWNGARVLAIDLDPQGNLTTQTGLSGSLAQLLFAGGEGGRPTLRWETASIKTDTKTVSLSVVTAFQELQAYEAIAGTRAHSRALRNALAEVTGKFDYVVVDCPPSLGGFTTNAMLAADEVIIPTMIQKNSVVGMNRTAQFAMSCVEDNPRLNVLGIVLMGYNPEAKSHTRFEQGLVPGLLLRRRRHWFASLSDVA